MLYNIQLLETYTLKSIIHFLLTFASGFAASGSDGRHITRDGRQYQQRRPDGHHHRSRSLQVTVNH